MNEDKVDQDFTITGTSQYKIYGYIRDHGYVGISGVTVTFSPNGGVATTSSNGYYEKFFECGFSCDVIPSKVGYTFSPDPIHVDNFYSDRNVNYAGELAGDIAVSGTILDINNNPMQNTTVIFQSFGQVTTNSSGQYSRNLPYNWSGQVYPQKTGWVFSPQHYDIANLQAPQTCDFSGTPSTGIAGVITDNGGARMSGVDVYAYNYDTQVVDFVFTTGSDGVYSIALPYHWHGRINPVKTGYNFTPEDNIYIKDIVR